MKLAIPYSRAGFTLIELIISMTLMVITSGILATIIALNFDVLEKFSDREKLLTRGILATTLFERELGMLIDSTNIVIADDQQFRFNDKYGNTFEYSVSSSNLTRQEIGVGSALNLASPVINSDTKFQYYSANNSELTSVPLSVANRKLVKLVKFKLVMDDGGDGVTLLSTVYPENLKIYNH